MASTRRLGRLRTELDSRLDLPPPPLVVALSGGADSAALAALARPRRLIHVHHSQPHSDLLSEAAARIAAVLGLELTVKKARVEPWSEGAARTARYELLLADLAPEEMLLTGHTADDQAETVLAHILRGTGPAGLLGIPARRDRIARPMLSVTRSETREFATLAGLPWIDDPTNADLGPLRNRIRHQLLPQLEADYNPAIREALMRLADLVETGPAAVAGEAINGGWRIANSLLWAAGPGRAARVLRESLRPWREGYGLERDEVEEVWKVVTGQRRAVELRGGLRVERDGSWLVCRSLPLVDS